MDAQENKNILKEVGFVSSKTTLPLLLYFVLYLSGIYYFLPMLIDYLRNNVCIITKESETFFTYIAIYLIIFPISILVHKLLNLKSDFKLRSLFCKPDKSVGWIAKWIIIAFGTTLITNVLSRVIFWTIECVFNITLQVGNTGLFISIVDVPETATWVITSIIFAPIFEEIFFRGIIF